ncbi:MAG TPA: extracellular solute-binding protein, partial [Chloroflexota bacterium]|nr:extracellular solute-binding protein [Chloroflexota bacterium]
MSSDRSFSRRDLLRQLAGRVSALAALGSMAACALRPTPTGPAIVFPTPLPTPPKSASPTTAKTTLRIWTNWLGPPRQAWDSLMARFNASQPTIAIASRYFTLATLQQMVITAVAAGTPPDLWINAALIRPEFIVDGAVVSLNQLGPVPADFYPAVDTATIRDGQRWGVPNNGGVPVIWYNEDLFRIAGLDPNRPPQTWDDLVR